MAGKDDFSKDEWEELQRGVTGAGMLVSVSHRDFTDSFGEASALAKDLGAHGESESQLVRELAQTHGTGFGFTASPSEVEEGTLEHCGLGKLLSEKAPDELDAYRAFVLDVANAVAGAKAGVQPEETAAIETITAALASG